MIPTKVRDDEQPADYEQLRRHLGRPPLDHPAGRRRVAAAPPAAPDARRPATRPRTAPDAPRPSRLSVVDWLLAIGRAVSRRMRRALRPPAVPRDRRT